MNDSCIIGYGTVGKATARVFGISRYLDLVESNITLDGASRCEYIFICLPTPVRNGEYDTTEIRKTIAGLSERRCSGIIILRSTVTPGTGKLLQNEYKVAIVANPEFLTESSAEYDALHPDFIVIGADNPNYAKAVKGLYEARFKGIDFIETDTTTAEAIKVVMNAFYVTKVVFANEIYDLCQKKGINYEQVKKAIYKSKYGTKNHFEVWHNEGRGAGGKCLEKDMEAFATYSDSSLLTLANSINKKLLSRYPRNAKQSILPRNDATIVGSGSSV